jgi:hypothetical protein
MGSALRGPVRLCTGGCCALLLGRMTWGGGRSSCENAAMGAPITPGVCLRLPPIVERGPRQKDPPAPPLAFRGCPSHLPPLALSTPPHSFALLCSVPPVTIAYYHAPG